jgi:peptide-methionine (R)-S-oxide reductase
MDKARRRLLTGMAAGVGLVLLAPAARALDWACKPNGQAGVPDMSKNKLAIPDPIEPLRLSDAEWQRRLAPEVYRVLRRAGTEPAGCSPLEPEARAGVYTCAGCDLPLFDSRDKFHSGTGWPSFTKPIVPRVVGQETDHKLLYPRTEVHCARCGGHLGHVFEDGPPPTGLRYCMNGAALVFKPS